MFHQAAGRQLRPIEAHDIMCKIADIVVVGGVRRSAMISLGDLADQAMAGAKGDFQVTSWEQLDDWGYHYCVEVRNAYGKTRRTSSSSVLMGWTTTTSTG